MARIRSIKPEFWIDEKIVELSSWARLLFIGMWNFTDDQGFIEYKPKRLKMQIFPADSVDIEALLEELLLQGVVKPYASPIGPVLHIVNWTRHQRVEKPAKARFERSELRPFDSPPPPPSPSGTTPGTLLESSSGAPGPVDAREGSLADDCDAKRTDDHTESADQGIRGTLPEASPTPPEASPAEWKGKEGKGEEGKGKDLPVAVGQEPDPDARAREAPSAQPEDLFLGRSILASIPRYRAAPGWARSKYLAPMAAAALASGLGRDAIVRYAEIVIGERTHKDHQHIPEFRHALERLSRDLLLGDACHQHGRPECDCEQPDRPWTDQDQADLARVLAHLDPDHLDTGTT